MAAFFPIAERELRVAARKRSSFWVRIVAALVAVALGSGFLTLFRYKLNCTHSLKLLQPMSNAPVSLGYVILYVNNVAASLGFYERAFGLTRRFFQDDHGKAYGELETGAARLAFASVELARAHVSQELTLAAPGRPPLGFEIALVASDVPALFARACAAGATAVSGPEVKPWGQTVAYVRDGDGCLVELCTPLP
jgi:lactoylglutathione lyase